MAAPGNNVDVEVTFNQIITEKLCHEHLQGLKTFTTALRNDQFRESVAEETFSALSRVLSRLQEDLQTSIAEGRKPQPVLLQLTAECFRCQRNACVQNTRNQDVIRRLGFINISLKLVKQLLSASMDSRYEPLRCGIQFLGNVAAGNQMSKDDVWQLVRPNLFLQLLNVDDVKTVDYASMVLHTCLDEAKVEELSQSQNIQVALRVMELCKTHDDLDWTFLIAIQHFFKSPALMERMYCEMCHKDRVSLLELVLAQIEMSGSDECGVSPGVARFLADCFQNSCGAVLKLSTDACASDDEEALTVITLLNVLCEMTSGSRQFLFLQDRPELLAATVELLEQVHAVGKVRKNVFSSEQNFSSTGDSSDSPVIGFKARLIRLIGNLCHKNPNNQNKVRELDGLPLILDNCNIDSNNPFICQWAVFAIRNLLEENAQNQELVASLEREGPVDYSALRELGFQVEERDGSLLLKPVRKDS
ncbi:hypothetical protein fugu_019788 [Takifugu bimaculatus]|uniref:Ataxin-10 n=1 Tax=Takifugu bimaculatus TaxID=433685 RepID=A0A4Z2BI59_9TELE|nr:hypothetical protein fugu_019788 [Takifugu bimaculatus]